MPIKVLFVCHNAGRTGAPFVLLHLAKWLAGTGLFQIEIAALVSGSLDGEFNRIGKYWVSEETTPRSHWWSRPGKVAPQALRQAGLATRLRHQSYDLIYSNTITNGLFVEEIRRDVPVITHVHELSYWIDRCGPENLDAVKRQTHHYIAASQAVKAALINSHGIDSSKVTVVHEFIDPTVTNASAVGSVESIRRRLGIDEEDLVIGCSGAEFWRKGRDLVPQLLARVNTMMNGKAVHLVWVGSNGSESEEYQLGFDMQALGLASLFHCTGAIDNPTDYFKIVDVFALLSRDDPFPLVCLENALLEKPIVCFSKAGGMPEFVVDEAGFIVPYLDIDAMAQAICLLFRDPSERKRRGEKARAKVMQACIVEVAAPRIAAIIKNSVISNSIE